jgi:hypothetical protein
VTALPVVASGHVTVPEGPGLGLGLVPDIRKVLTIQSRVTAALHGLAGKRLLLAGAMGSLGRAQALAVAKAGAKCGWWIAPNWQRKGRLSRWTCHQRSSSART